MNYKKYCTPKRKNYQAYLANYDSMSKEYNAVHALSICTAKHEQTNDSSSRVFLKLCSPQNLKIYSIYTDTPSINRHIIIANTI